MLKIEVKYIAYIILAVAFAGCDTPFFSPRENYQTPFEQTDGTKSSSYEEVIDYYKDLSKEFASISFKTMGQTDNGQPLHLVSTVPMPSLIFPSITKIEPLFLLIMLFTATNLMEWTLLCCSFVIWRRMKSSFPKM